MAYKITDDCIACGACTHGCFFDAISLSPGDKIYTINPAICNDCKVCLDACPVEAIIPDASPAKT